MGENSKIQWTGATWNPWQGCLKISPGCKFCYMYRDKERYGQDPAKVVRSQPKTFDLPLKLQREVERGDRTGTDRLVFTCSWSDFFIEQADAWRADAWEIIRACPDLIFQVLTKRTDLVRDRLPAGWPMTFPIGGWPNVWLMASVERQEEAWRIGQLLNVPATVRGLSVEPMLAPVKLAPYHIGWYRCPECGEARDPSEEKSLGSEVYCSNCDHEGPLPIHGHHLHWVIIGGESGNKFGYYQARPCELDWVRDLVWECRQARIPCFVKQLGSCASDTVNGPAGVGLKVPREAAPLLSRRLKAPHGGDPAEWPEDLRVRELPEVATS